MLSAKKRRKTGIFCFYSPNYERGCSLTTDHAVALSIHCIVSIRNWYLDIYRICDKGITAIK